MKVLLICPDIPTPPRYGKGISARNYGFITQLTGEHEVVVNAFYENDNEKIKEEYLKQYCKRIVLVKRKNKSIALVGKVVLSIIGKTPLRVLLWKNREMEKAIRVTLKEYRPDVVHISGFMMMVYAGIVEQYCSNIVLDIVDSKAMYIERDIVSSWKKKLPIFEVERRQVLNYEKELVKKHRKCVYISEVDRDFISKIAKPVNTIEIIKNGFWQIDQEIIPAVNSNMSISFVGDMSYLPNVDAMKYFCRDVLSLIVKKIPSISLYIIGRNPCAAIRRLATNNNNIVVTGEVKDVNEFLSKTSVFVCPMRIGSGMNTKILEAMRLGLPVVGTTVANEGVWAKNGKEIVIADDNTKYAESIIELLLDEGKRKMLAMNALEFIKQQYDWSSIGKKLLRLYEK